MMNPIKIHHSSPRQNENVKKNIANTKITFEVKRVVCKMILPSEQLMAHYFFLLSSSQKNNLQLFKNKPNDTINTYKHTTICACDRLVDK